jgi:hypothetical protein
MEKKRRAIGNLLEMIFGHLITYMTIFLVLVWDREAAEVALKDLRVDCN